MNNHIKKSIRKFFERIFDMIIRADKIVYVPIFIYVATFFTLCALRYFAYTENMHISFWNQIMWNTIHGRLFECSIGGAGTYQLSFHFQPIVFLIALIYALYQDPITLLFLQTLSIGLGALPIYWLAKERLHSRFVAICIATSYLLFTPLQYANMNGFNITPFSISILLFAFYYLQKSNYKGFLLFSVLALFVEETMIGIVFMLGVYAFLKKSKRVGITVSIMAVLWFFLAFYIIFPHFGGGAYHLRFLGNYSGFSDFLKTLIFDPGQVIKSAMGPDGAFILPKCIYLLALFLPVGFLPLLHPSTLLIALPTFAVALVSVNGLLFNVFYFYDSPIIPFLFISVIYGLERVSSVKKKGKSHIEKIFDKTHTRALLYLITICLLSMSLYTNTQVIDVVEDERGHFQMMSPSPLSTEFMNRIHWYQVSDRDRSADKIIENIPPSSSLSTPPIFFEHASKRRIINNFPHSYDIGKHGLHSDYALIDSYLPQFPLATSGYFSSSSRQNIPVLLNDLNYTLGAVDGGLWLFFNRTSENISHTYLFDSTIFSRSSEGNTIRIIDGKAELYMKNWSEGPGWYSREFIVNSSPNHPNNPIWLEIIIPDNFKYLDMEYFHQDGWHLAQSVALQSNISRLREPCKQIFSVDGNQRYGWAIGKLSTVDARSILWLRGTESGSSEQTNDDVTKTLGKYEKRLVFFYYRNVSMSASEEPSRMHSLRMRFTFSTIEKSLVLAPGTKASMHFYVAKSGMYSISTRNARDLIDQSQDMGYGNVAGVIYGNNSHAQQFNPEHKEITKAEIFIRKRGFPPDLVVELQTDNGQNEPSGTILTSGILPKSSVSWEYGWSSVNLQYSRLNASSKYWLVFRTTGGDNHNLYAILCDSSNPYLEGSNMYTNDGRNWTGFDLGKVDAFFRTYYGQSTDGSLSIRLDGKDLTTMEYPNDCESMEFGHFYIPKGEHELEIVNSQGYIMLKHIIFSLIE